MFHSVPAPEWDMSWQRLLTVCSCRGAASDGCCHVGLHLSPHLFPVCEMQNCLLQRNNKSFQGCGNCPGDRCLLMLCFLPCRSVELWPSSCLCLSRAGEKITVHLCEIFLASGISVVLVFV